MTLVFEDFALLFVCVMHVASIFVAVPVAVNVILTATIILYVGSLRSVVTLMEPAVDETPGLQPGARLSKREESVTLSSGDALRFPLVGSAFLLSAYFLIKILGRDALNILLTVYFAAFGAFAIEGAVEAELARWVDVLAEERRRLGCVVAIKPALLARVVGQRHVDCRLTPPQCACWVVALIVIVWYACTKHFLLNNAIAACLALSACEMISVGSFRNAAVLLAGLFVYDITWVFGSDVMVTVAKGIDGPIKLLFVRGWIDSPSSTKKKPEFSMLGLGDIVVPGLLVAMLLRFDVRQQRQRGQSLVNGGARSWPYFRSGLVAYAAGLGVTLAVMFLFDAAQPALLYLVPACLGACLALAAARGELGLLTSYAEDDDDDDDDAPDAVRGGADGSSSGAAAATGVPDERDKLIDRTTLMGGSTTASTANGAAAGYLGVQDDRKQD